MGLEYVRKHHQILTSEVLKRDIFVDEIADLDDSSLDRLLAEAEVMLKCLSEDHDALPPSDEARAHIRHIRNVWKVYRQVALIEKRLRGIDASEKFYELVAERIGTGEARALMAQARG